MLEKLGQLAEQAATNVSRRQMFGQIGRAALGAVALLAGLLPSQTEAARGLKQCVVCYYLCPDGSYFAVRHRGRGCAGNRDGCELWFAEGCGV